MRTSPSRPAKISTSAIMALGILVLLALSVGGAWFYRTEEQHLRHAAELELEAIARLKASQIAAWREARLDDAAILMERVAFISDAEQWLAAPSAKTAEQILQRFRSMQKHYRYHDVLLVDPDGEVRLSLSGYSGLHCERCGAPPGARRDRAPC